MKTRGFTLLEVLLAAVLTAFVALVAVAGLRSVSMTRTTIDQASEAADALRYAAEILERDLASIARNSVIFEAIAADPAIGMPPSLRMRIYQTDPARPNSPESDLYEVEYSLLQSEDKTLFVRRICPLVGVEVDREETSGGILTVLSESILDFQAQYFDGSQWLDYWLTETELPQLVLINLLAADTSQLQKNSSTSAKQPRVLQKTIWMFFPGQPHLGQNTSTTTTTTTQTETTVSGETQTGAQ
ncbi:MAG TPA: prepilin-type N-terminal cleavage/methylation domain-containing protein [Anaerohalosphaeraceae bacterium]|nr:prepilin-type N-terminal cleavage/methylation domain-containing protein [Anaerohalosphaeraceae bacterium]HOL89759.1 prepilin-type N-terminal cleavage/methylation domain-containing protein [Anaerohalosphaeraceae bacterium]HPP57201.1 prepilin-type N-terminal cleavage/methylation domain-containing protein [Anaerohalosphaeraceae bacterium]